MITSIQNPKIKLVRELLANPRAREETGTFVVEGVRLAEEALNNQWVVQFGLWSNQLSDRGERFLQRLKSLQVPMEEIPASLMSKISDTESPQGILLVMAKKVWSLPTPLDFLVVLDGVRDPGNLGTILRSATAFGVQAVILIKGSVDPLSPKVVRSAMGAHFQLPILDMSAGELVHFCHEQIQPALKIYLADIRSAIPCWDVDLRTPLALVIGGEAAGASQELVELADGRLLIPMPGRSESLNAAVAASVLLYEVVRQRKT